MKNIKHFKVENSCIAYHEMISETCSICLPLGPEFEWGKDLKKSTLVPQKRSPIIFIELTLTEDGGGFVTRFEDIQTTIINIFDAAIQSTQAVPQIERSVVDKIFWKDNALLESVGKQEPHIVQTRNKIEKLVNASLRPLLAYAREYDQVIIPTKFTKSF